MDFDAVVVGKGLIGSAVAKYLSRALNRVAIVGPDEPDDLDHGTIFSSHYDSGRVQRQVGRNETMTRLNIQSAQQYPGMIEETGIAFHGGVGCLYVNPGGMNAYLASAAGRAERYGVDVTTFADSDALAHAFPELRFPDTSLGMFEPSPSGYINPRSLIQAQLRIASSNGGTIIREHVMRVDSKGAWVEVTTHEGATLRAKSALVATGAFTNATQILRANPALVLKSETVLLARVNGNEAKRLATLPSLLYDIDVEELEGIYATPPLAYPDGNSYLKMGCNLPEDIYFRNDLGAIQQWFRSGESDTHIGKMSAALMGIMPNLEAKDFTSKRCILTRTESHGNPYVGQVDDRLYLAIGNGWSAMSSDAIGRVAAHVMLEGGFPEGFSAETFEPVLGD